MANSKIQPEIQIEWWGTAAFRIRYQGWTGLLDPYVTRNPFAEPQLKVNLEQAAREANDVFVTHGHFDHVIDIPALMQLNRRMHVYAPARAARTLIRDGGDGARIIVAREGGIVENGHVDVEAYRSKHVRFDTGLVCATLARGIFSGEKSKYFKSSLLTRYPCGEVMSYVYTLGGTRIRFLGSAGPTDEMLEDWAQRRDDVLLLPLQGNSKICELGARIVEKLKPEVVIPHHHDNFYPPVSQTVDITEFRELVARRSPRTRIVEIPFGGTHVVSGVSVRRQGLGLADRGDDLEQHLTP